MRMSNDDGILDFALCEDDNETVMKYYNLSEVHPVGIVFHSFILSAIILVGVCGNAFVLCLVAKDKRLRYRSVIASVSVVVVDFLLTIFFHGVALTSTLRKKWAYDDNFMICHLYSILSTYFIYVRWIALCLIATDRFLTVRFPFHYQRHSRRFLIILTVLVWGIPVVATGGIVSLPFIKPTFRANIPTCLPSCVDEHTLCRLIRIGSFIATLIFGLIPTALHTWMYKQARKLRKDNTYTLGQFPTSTEIENQTEEEPQTNEVKRAEQTLITSILIYLTVLFTSLPQFFVVLLRNINICAFFKLPIYVHFVTSDIFFFSTALDPIVIMRNKDFRTAIKDIFCK